MKTNSKRSADKYVRIQPALIRLARLHIVKRRTDHESFLDMCREAVDIALDESFDEGTRTS